MMYDLEYFVEIFVRPGSSRRKFADCATHGLHYVGLKKNGLMTRRSALGNLSTLQQDQTEEAISRSEA
jgi:hypothetical protein